MTGSIASCSVPLERERRLGLFPNTRALVWLGDVAIKAVKAIARRSDQQTPDDRRGHRRGPAVRGRLTAAGSPARASSVAGSDGCIAWAASSIASAISSSERSVCSATRSRYVATTSSSTPSHSATPAAAARHASSEGPARRLITSST
jgi:hypothetical protein